jgi:hypothetical protein
LFVEHLESCAVILGRWPSSAADVRYRMSRLLLMQRWQDDGARYGDFLRASLALRFSPKVLAALVANQLLGLRR